MGGELLASAALLRQPQQAQHAAQPRPRHTLPRQTQQRPPAPRRFGGSAMTPRGAPSATGASGGGSGGSVGGVQRIVRRLILMRHADSAATAPSVRDHDRPISALGQRQAVDAAAQLAALGWVPEVVLASNARRTRQTLEAMTEGLPGLEDADTHMYGSLYTIAALDGQTRQHIEECLLEVVPDRVTCVAVVGHNKGMEEAASSMAGAAVKLTPGSAALMEVAATSWKDVLGDHKAELKKGIKDEDWSTHRGVTWRLESVITPAEASP